MSTESSMTVLTAFIRPSMEMPVVRALHDLGHFPGFTITEVRAQGRGTGPGGAYEASAEDLTYRPMLRLQLVCRSEVAGQISRTISAAAWTGRKGDGVIYFTAAGSFTRIREVGRPEAASP